MSIVLEASVEACINFRDSQVALLARAQPHQEEVAAAGGAEVGEVHEILAAATLLALSVS